MAEFIVHADAHWVVVDKPAGLPAVPGRPAALHDCAATHVQARYADALVVHRLDMATSGLLVFARGAMHQRNLSRAFAERRVRKCYVAVVQGSMAADCGSIELSIAADWPNRPLRVVDAARGKASLTHWRVRERSHGRTLLELEPVTGRTHQLRVHLAAIGHPILGDTLYAPPGIASCSPRLLLHASELELAHPAHGASTRFTSHQDFPPLL